tara:strand:+ start:121 stop:525 length:405 start_codon:yes stop_codon:yes gene_type:complete
MAGLAPALPLRRDENDGYKLVKSFGELALQNLKMLILTSPGEKMMDPEFGVGLRNYLFRHSSPMVYGDIETKIRSQTAHYLPYIKILSVNFKIPKEFDYVEKMLSVNVEYFVTPLRVKGSLIFDLDFLLDEAGL